MKPKLDSTTQTRIQMFLERGHYSTPEQVIAAAVDLLVQDQINKDSKIWNDSLFTPEEISAQLHHLKSKE